MATMWVGCWPGSACRRRIRIAWPLALADLGYPYVEETDNPACRLFLDGV